jgi:peptidyl-prolyl cis-trans isomerase C
MTMATVRHLVCSAAVLALAAGCGGDKKSDEDKAKAGEQQGAELKHGLTEEQSKQVLAKVGETVITVGDFAERLAGQSPYLRARYASPERRTEFLDNMVRFELLALEAKKRGHEQQPEVDRVRRQMMVQQMMKEMFDEKGVKLSDITDAEIKAYYDANPAEFHKPAQRRASHILFKDKAKAEAILKKLQNAADDMELFRKLAEEHTQDAETKPRFGDLRFFSHEPAAGDTAPPKPVRDAVFALDKTGALAPQVVQSEQGFHVVKMTGERAALERSLEDARRLIQNRLWRKKREEAIERFVSDLRKKGEVKENLGLLSQVKIDTQSPAPQGAALPPSLDGVHPAPADEGGDKVVN